jgi:hypothetical protein
MDCAEMTLVHGPMKSGPMLGFVLNIEICTSSYEKLQEEHRIFSSSGDSVNDSSFPCQVDEVKRRARFDLGVGS